MRSLAAITNGVASIDRIIAASIGCSSSARHDAGDAGERQQHEAELAALRERERRRAARCRRGAPKARDSAAISANLHEREQQRGTASTSQNCATTRRRSSSMPTVTKNSPSSTSRNGWMSSSTWKRYSVSEISMPARNAPSASDRPAAAVTKAASSVISSTFSTNSSFERRRATARSQARIGRGPPTITMRERGRRLGERQRHGDADRVGRLARARDQHQQRHDREVLEQQHRDHLAAVRAVELAALGEQLGDDRGRGHRGDAAEREPGLPRQRRAARRRRRRARWCAATCAPPSPNTRRRIDHQLAAG